MEDLNKLIITLENGELNYIYNGKRIKDRDAFRHKMNDEGMKIFREKLEEEVKKINRFDNLWFNGILFLNW